MKKIIAGLALLSSVSAFSQTIATIENKAKDQLEISCKTSTCSEVTFKLNGNAIKEVKAKSLNDRLFFAQGTVYKTSKSEQFSFYNGLQGALWGPRQEGGGEEMLTFVPPITFIPVTLLAVDAIVLAPVKGISNTFKKKNLQKSVDSIVSAINAKENLSITNRKFKRIIKVVENL
jgi:hypothetical protein